MTDILSFDAAQRGAGRADRVHPERPYPEFFGRAELNRILQLYARKVAGGEWRDYAMGLSEHGAEFAIYRRTAEGPLFRIVKRPRSWRRHGGRYMVTAPGRVLKVGLTLDTVLAELERKSLSLVGG
jgi:hypothetical protein